MDKDMTIVDLSLPIQNHWRWRYHRTIERDYTMGGPLREEFLYMPVHCFTHIDPPGHAFASARMMDEIPIGDLIGPARVLDVSDKPPNYEITGDDLEKAGASLKGSEIAVIRTGQTQRHSIDEAEFWTTSPYLSQSAADWLVEKKIKAAAFDFPQDFALRDFFRGIIPTIEQLVVHKTLLGSGVLQIEYVTNLEELPVVGSTLYAIPLKLAGIAGSPARVFAYVPSET